MDRIPVKFEYEGREVKGTLTHVWGAGTNSMFHLNVGGYHWGPDLVNGALSLESGQ